MWLIVGLGNPGQEYANTRHNVGFMAVEALASRHKVNLPQKSEHRAETGRFQIGSEVVLVAQPQTYMNLSGESVQPLMNFYKIPMERLLVIHDEVDLPFQKMRFQKNRGPGGHNGLKSLNQHLGSQDYARLKLGVGRPLDTRFDVSDYVLQSFSKEERAVLPELLKQACDGVESFIKNGLEKTASVFNREGTS